MSRLPRWMHHAYANAAGYFWKPCPLCGKPFGGHEWRDVDGKSSVIKDPEQWWEVGSGIGICPDCTRAGLGRSDLSGDNS